ncbi:MAG: anaerobic ribonucleoside-triphosphate reductase activating protein [Oscillospiraceae bacterium]
MMSTLKIAGIVGDSITDGPGIRTAVFVQGCPHKCEGCHNPQSHDFNGGTEMDVDEIFKKIEQNPLLSGVTFSGGEPFCQAGGLAELGKKVKSLGLEIAIYTGYTFEQLMSGNDPDRMELLSLCDILVDGRFILAQRSLDLKFKGSKNQRTIDVQRSLETGEAVLDNTERWT